MQFSRLIFVKNNKSLLAIKEKLTSDNDTF